jgi:methyl-accepting chemotaxis protein
LIIKGIILLKIIQILNKLNISTKILINIMVFSIPITVMFVIIITGIYSSINFAKYELMGNMFQSPVESIFENLLKHRDTIFFYSDKDKKEYENKIENAFSELSKMSNKIGTDLQFTTENLEKRNLQNLSIKNMKEKWEEIKILNITNDDLFLKYDNLLKDLKDTISYIGDKSNLILDPDLDSYYLMDSTLLALPQTQNNLSELAKSIFSISILNQQKKKELIILTSMLKESCVQRVLASTKTSFNEDANFYGLSPTLSKNLTPVLIEFEKNNFELIESLNGLIDSEGNDINKNYFYQKIELARDQSFILWHKSKIELDVLLNKRIIFYQENLRRSIIYVLIALIIAVTWALFSNLSIIGSMKNIQDSIKKILSEKDFSLRIETSKFSIGIYTEIGKLSNEINNFKDELNNNIVTIKNFTEGHGKAAGLIENTGTSIVINNKKLSEMTEEIIAITEEFRATLENINLRVSNENKSIEDNQDSIINLNSGINKIITSANDSIDIIKSIQEFGNIGIIKLETSVNNTIKLNEEIKIINNLIKSIKNDSERIDSMLKVISDISYKTNLLAINAAIESSHAGVAGKGFAVVASEVRSLSESTAKSTKEISYIINTIKSSINESVLKVGIVKEESEKNKILAEESMTSISGIINNISKVGKAVSVIKIISLEQGNLSKILLKNAELLLQNSSEITSSIDEQSKGISMISESMISLSQIIDDSVKHSQVLSDTSNQLKNQSNELIKIVNEFKLS